MPPRLTLRAGNAIDDFAVVPPWDERIDHVGDEYLEQYFWGCHYLDPDSWKHYLPSLMDYSVRHWADGSSMVVESLLSTLRPASPDDAKITSLTAPQEHIICRFLELLAFEDESAFQAEAQQVLQEYWIDHSIYRSSKVFA